VVLCGGHPVNEGEQPQRHLRLIKSDESKRDVLPSQMPVSPRYGRGQFSGIFNLAGKVALVVGGAGGIGGAIAHALADHGARIVIADLNGEAARQMAQSCARPNTGGALAVNLDITNQTNIQQTVAAIERETQKIDILVNAAGINIRKPVVDLAPEEWQQVLAVNLSGVFYVTQAVVRGMLSREYGRILSLGSVSSLLGHPNYSAYAATKGGIAIMTKSMATEWASKGITVNALGPAYTETAFNSDFIANPSIRESIVRSIPMGRLGKPEDMVGAAVYLCSDAASFVTGQTLYIDGGRTSD